MVGAGGPDFDAAGFRIGARHPLGFAARARSEDAVSAAEIL